MDNEISYEEPEVIYFEDPDDVMKSKIPVKRELDFIMLSHKHKGNPVSTRFYCARLRYDYYHKMVSIFLPI